MLLQLMYGSRTAEAISATNTMNQIRLAELFASTIAEHAGIVAASAIYSFGRVSGLMFPFMLHHLKAELSNSNALALKSHGAYTSWYHMDCMWLQLVG